MDQESKEKKKSQTGASLFEETLEVMRRQMPSAIEARLDQSYNMYVRNYHSPVMQFLGETKTISISWPMLGQFHECEAGDSAQLT